MRLTNVRRCWLVTTIAIAQVVKPFTLWNLVDGLTHLNVNLRFAGDRNEADQKVAKLMELAV